MLEMLEKVRPNPNPNPTAPHQGPAPHLSHSGYPYLCVYLLREPRLVQCPDPGPRSKIMC